MPLSDYTYWIDANLPPKTKGWLTYHFGVEAKHVYEMIGLLAADESMFLAAKNEGNVIILTKDKDFADLLRQQGPPPKVIWITAGNLSNDELHLLIKTSFRHIATQLTDTDLILIELNRTQ